MTVTPYPTNLFHDRKELYQILCTGKQQSIAKKCPQIVSISQEIEPLDPLAVLQAIARPDQLQFYFEQRSKNKAIAAIDAVISLKTEGSDRFLQAQHFITSCLANTLKTGNLELPFAGPHFFCSFTFFDNQIASDSPFPSATVFLPRWQVACYENRCGLVVNIEVSPQVNIDFILENLCSTIKSIKPLRRSISNIAETNQPKFINQGNKQFEHFKLAVASALKSIQDNQFRKIVLASAIDVVSPQPFNLFSSLINLRKRQPDCYIFSTSNGKGQNFIGASPERLLSIQNQQLVTDALAGSAPRSKIVTEDAEFADRLLSSEKERREHQFVRDFIIERLSRLGFRPEWLATPQLLKLSNIQHLWTPIHAQRFAGIHALEIVAELHPTPAVAGVPTKIAQEQIRRYETFDRSLYAAPLGWVDYQGNCEFIVGIRSALIESEKPSQTDTKNYHARLYAGAGIVAGSDPNKELAEIQLKLQALLKALLEL